MASKYPGKTALYSAVGRWDGEVASSPSTLNGMSNSTPMGLMGR